MFEFDEGENARYRLAGIIESSEDAIIAITKDGVITDWNGAATRLYGYSAEEAVGINIRTLLPPNRANEIEEIQNTLAAGGRIHQYESVRQRKDGSLVMFHSVLLPLQAKAEQLSASQASLATSPIADAWKRYWATRRTIPRHGRGRTYRDVHLSR